MTTTKIGSTDFSLPHAHFIKHLTIIETPPQKHDKKLEKIKPWFRWFKNKTDFHLKKLSPNQKLEIAGSDGKI
jgi:hypothetical protein